MRCKGTYYLLIRKKKLKEFYILYAKSPTNRHFEELKPSFFLTFLKK